MEYWAWLNKIWKGGIEVYILLVWRLGRGGGVEELGKMGWGSYQ
jgi:hypothetical protein